MIRDTAATDVAIAPRSGPSRRTLLIGSGALLLALGVLWTGAQLSAAQRSVDGSRLRLAAVQRGPFVSDVSAQGRVVAAVAPTVYAPAAGVVTLLVQAGDRVEAGQPLATLDSPEVTSEYQREDANLQSQRSGLERARIEADTRRAALRQAADLARVEADAAERELARGNDAHALGVMAQSEVDQRADALATARVRRAHAVEDTRLQDRSLALDVRTRELDVQRQELLVANLKRRVDELTARAPVAGVVGAVSVVQKAAVAQNQALLTVVDLSALEVEVLVPESYADSLGLDMAAEVRLGTEVRPGRLVAVSPEVTNGQVPGRVRLEGDGPTELRQNQRVTVRILLDSRDDVLSVQRGPFLEAGSGRWAYVVRDGIATRTPIRTGATSAGAVEIVEGLQAGDQIVISGIDAFGDAETARIR